MYICIYIYRVDPVSQPSQCSIRLVCAAPQAEGGRGLCGGNRRERVGGARRLVR